MEIKKSPKHFVKNYDFQKVGNNYRIIFFVFKALWCKYKNSLFSEKKFILKFFFGHFIFVLFF